MLTSNISNYQTRAAVSEEKINLIRTLHSQGHSVTAIALMAKVSRGSVRKYTIHNGKLSV